MRSVAVPVQPRMKGMSLTSAVQAVSRARSLVEGQRESLRWARRVIRRRQRQCVSRRTARTAARRRADCASCVDGEHVCLPVVSSTHRLRVMRRLVARLALISMAAVAVVSGASATAPSGTVYYSGQIYGETNSYDIYSATVGVGRPRKLTRSNFDELTPAVSSDGRRVAYVVCRADCAPNL